jgi:transcription initiation factor TFIID subunit 15
LKDFARQSGLDVVYSEVARERDGRGLENKLIVVFPILNLNSYVEYETLDDLTSAVEKLDGREFKGTDVSCVADVCPSPLSGISLTLK